LSNRLNKHKKQKEQLIRELLLYESVPGMAQFLRVKVPPRVFTAKCSEPQAAVSNDRRGGSGVAKPASLRTETGYKAKRRERVLYNPKPEG
jgi:hypothetical protein